MINKPKYKKTLILGDIHAPYYDKRAFNAMLAFSKWWKPEYIYLNGDIIDFYSISRFDKDPSRIVSLQDDIDCAHDLIKQVRKANPNAGITFNEGNHEIRLIKYKWNKAPELSCLRGLEIESLLKLDELGINYQKDFSKFKNTIIKHGTVVRKHSAYTARAEFEKTGMSGVNNHTHRLGNYFLTNISGEYMWLEGGCLCDLKPEYYEGGTPNWQHGFIIGFYKSGSTRFNLDQVQIIHGKAMYGGYEFY
jgi:hypothetical protein